MTIEKIIECLNYQNEKFFGGQSEALKIAISYIKCFDGTNGEVLQSLFPKCEKYIDDDGWIITTIDGFTEFTPEFWNAPFNIENEDKK